MLSISSTLLDKVKEKMQTIGNNANPKMEVIAQKAAKYLNQGSFLIPKTVRTGNSLGPLDICIRREDVSQEPTEIVMAYIENGYAKVATLPYVSKPTDNFVYQYTIGPADDVACDFDGRWVYISDHTGIYFDTSIRWALVTFSEPYFALVNQGALIVYQVNSNADTLVSENIVSCSMLRGWKSTNHVLTDQGIICSYIKTDGKVYYRNYCEQEDGSYIWETEKEIIEFGSIATSISLFRTADYRTGFLATVNGTMQMLISHRSWSAMAINPDHITAKITNMSVAVKEISFNSYRTNTEHLSANISNMAVNDLYAISPVMHQAINIANEDEDYGYLVQLDFDERVYNTTGNESQFILSDSTNRKWYAQSIQNNGRRILIQFTNMNNAHNPVQLEYTPGTVTGDIANLDACSISFAMVALVPYVEPPPVLTEIKNTDNKTIILTFDQDISSIGSIVGFAVSGFEPLACPGDVLVATTYVVDSVIARIPPTIAKELTASQAILSGMEAS